jgi:hypothetical protein
MKQQCPDTAYPDNMGVLSTTRSRSCRDEARYTHAWHENAKETEDAFDSIRYIRIDIVIT